MANEKIAFLGLGAMGFGMASNLLKQHPQYTITGYDVWAPSLARFVSLGGLSSTTPRSCVLGAKYVIFMVATASQIVSALFTPETGAVHALEPNAVVILSSTGPPEHAPAVRKRLDEEYGRGDVMVIDAPVSGGTIRAANGTLTILASGDEGSLAAGNAVLEAMSGPNLYVIPGGLGAGTKVKMVHQVLAGIHIVMASEAMSFAAAFGSNTKNAFEVLRNGEGSSWMFENRVPHMLVGDKVIYSATNIIVKDIGIVTAGGRSSDFPLFLASTTEQVLASAVSAGLGPIDDSGIVGLYHPQDPTIVLKLTSSPLVSTETAEEEKKLKLVAQAMAGVHLAAAAEAMSLGAKVGLETKQLAEIIAGAAGSSVMFKESVGQWLSGEWTSSKTIDDVVAELTEALEEAGKMKFPLNLTATALQLFQLARLRGWGKEPDAAIVKIWDVSGELFPRKK